MEIRHRSKYIVFLFLIICFYSFANTSVKEEKVEQAQKQEVAKKVVIKSEHVNPGVLIIGDSITLGVQKYLAKHIDNSYVNAKGSRSMKPAVALFREYKKNNQLREFIVFCIGTNAMPNDPKVVLQLLEEIPKGHSLILMTAFDGRANEKWNSSKLTRFYRTLPAKYPFVTIADWNIVASKNLQIYGHGDRVHFAGNQEGNRLYTQCIQDALKEAQQKPRK